MRKTMLGLVAALALAAAGAANAGCWATVGISPLPDGVAAGAPWTVDVRVLQHGKTPMDDATPAVVVANARTGERLAVPAKPADPARGRYRAEVVFPSAGSWSVAVADGFPIAECARTHTFGTYTIGDPVTPAPGESQPPTPQRGSFPVLPVTLGLALGGAVLALAATMGVRSRRTRIT